MNPAVIVAGDDVSWEETIQNIDAASYHFNLGDIAAEAVGSNVGDVWTFTLTGADSGILKPGLQLVRLVTTLTGSGSRVTEFRSGTTVRENPENPGNTFAARMVALLETDFENDAPKFLESHTIGGTTITKMSLAEKKRLLERFRAEMNREQYEAAGNSRMIRTNFNTLY